MTKDPDKPKDNAINTYQKNKKGLTRLPTPCKREKSVNSDILKYQNFYKPRCHDDIGALFLHQIDTKVIVLM
jgi:hypothetical protein